MSVIVIDGIDGEVVLEAGEERQHRLDIVIEEEIGGRGGDECHRCAWETGKQAVLTNNIL